MKALVGPLAKKAALCASSAAAHARRYASAGRGFLKGVGRTLIAPDEEARSIREAVGTPLKAALVTVTLGLGGLIGWGRLAQIDSAVVASGTLAVELNRRNLQHLEGGIVGRVLVRDGDAVKAGQPLIELDDTRVRAQLNVVRDESDRLRARAAVLSAEKAGLSAPVFPSHLVDRRDEPTVADLLAVQENEFAARRKALEGQTAILTQRIAQLLKQIDGLDIRIASIDRQLGLVRLEIEGIEDLVKRGLERNARMWSLQREEARLLGDKGEAIETVARTRQTIGETELQRAQLLRTRDEDIAKELREIQGRLQELREREISASDQMSRLTIDAPEGGTVMDLRFTTRGGVIAPGAQIASIVPEEERLVVDARIAPSDVNTLRAGMTASIRLVHAAGSLTPTIDGVVERISPDSIADPKTGQQFFSARIDIPAEEIRRNAALRLQSGMQVDVLIRRGERSAASYVLRPVLDRFAKSMREF